MFIYQRERKKKKIKKMGWERGERGGKGTVMAVSQYLGPAVSLDPSDVNLGKIPS